MGSHGARSVKPSLGYPKRLYERILALCKCGYQGLHILILLFPPRLHTTYIPAPGRRGRRRGGRRGKHLPRLVITCVFRAVAVSLIMHGSLPGRVRVIAMCVAVGGSLPCAINITVVSISIIYPL